MSLSELDEQILKCAYLLFRKGINPFTEKQLFNEVYECEYEDFLYSLEHLISLGYFSPNGELTVYGLSYCRNFEVDKYE